VEHLFHALSKIQLGLGVVEGLKVTRVANGGGAGFDQVACADGMARVGPAAGGNPTNKAELGMNQPGVVRELASLANLACLPNGTAAAVKQLVWLKVDGSGLLVTRDRAPGESYADVLPGAQLQDNPFKGAMIDGRAPGSLVDKKLQEGPIRGVEPAAVLLAKITVNANSSVISAVDNTVKTRVLT
jgi:hypothetical protein